MIKTCPVCSKEFCTFPYKVKLDKGKYCSRKCYELSKRGKPSWNKGLSNTWMIGNQYRKGKKNPYLSKLNTSKVGDLNPKWRGDKVGYYGLHNWVRRQLGTPHRCDFCHNESLRHRQYHWANKSGRYLRDINDWLRLCTFCHKKYDM